MNPKTGAIAEFENIEDAKEANYTETLTTDEARKLLGMCRNRHERREVLAQLRREKRKAKKK